MIDPLAAHDRLTPDEIRRSMLGLAGESESLRFERELTRQSELISMAAAATEADAFVVKLKRFHSQPARETPRMTNDQSNPLPAGTELESNEEVESIRAELKRAGQRKQTKSQSRKIEQPFRPTIRPPVAMLILCDDGENTGEVFRLRGERFIIGRSEGDLQLPDDAQISSRHVALTRQTVGNQTRWVITDLQSRNGLFVRVGKAPLPHQAEFLVGGGRYRLEIMQQAVAETAAYEDQLRSSRPSATRAFIDSTPVGSTILSEVLSQGVGARFVLGDQPYWIGSDADCDIGRPDDPFVSGKHACLARSPRGTWMIQSNHSVNGIWIKMPQVILEQGRKCEFQISEQRFRLRFGVPL